MCLLLEIPVPSLKKGSDWLDVFPTERVTLRCGMIEGRSEWTYIWSKDGQEIPEDTNLSFGNDKSTLTILSAKHSNRGNYSCKGKFKARSVSSGFSSEVTLKVYGEIYCLLFGTSFLKRYLKNIFLLR